MSRNKGDAYTITAVEADVFVVRGSHVNWSILTEGSGMTLIDAGYPGNSAAVLDSLEEVSAKTGAHRLEAIVITHGHSDHIGASRLCWTRSQTLLESCAHCSRRATYAVSTCSR